MLIPATPLRWAIALIAVTILAWPTAGLVKLTAIAIGGALIGVVMAMSNMEGRAVAIHVFISNIKQANLEHEFAEFNRTMRQRLGKEEP